MFAEHCFQNANEELEQSFDVVDDIDSSSESKDNRESSDKDVHMPARKNESFTRNSSISDGESSDSSSENNHPSM